MRTQKKTFVTVGCGGMGTWVTILLSADLVTQTSRIVLIDYDRLEASNRNRIPFPLHCVGQYKVEWLADFLRARFPHEYVPLATSALNAEVFDELDRADVIFDCTDRFEVQCFLSSRWDDKVVRLGSNEHHLTVRYPSDTSIVWSSDSDESLQQCGVTVPQLLHVQVIAAAIGVTVGLQGHQTSVSMTLPDDIIQGG